MVLHTPDEYGYCYVFACTRLCRVTNTAGFSGVQSFFFCFTRPPKHNNKTYYYKRIATTVRARTDGIKFTRREYNEGRHYLVFFCFTTTFVFSEVFFFRSRFSDDSTVSDVFVNFVTETCLRVIEKKKKKRVGIKLKSFREEWRRRTARTRAAVWANRSRRSSSVFA